MAYHIELHLTDLAQPTTINSGGNILHHQQEIIGRSSRSLFQESDRSMQSFYELWILENLLEKSSSRTMLTERGGNHKLKRVKSAFF
ncbi:hypothetical protein LIER_30981 [Lithospermum erythrorhizon]|uniref:Uncharacterized protein n=1 Tax=Lithospermum erythrorhizon TaxID=34254 RepID=A0AAV3RSQ4_LITER